MALASGTSTEDATSEWLTRHPAVGVMLVVGLTAAIVLRLWVASWGRWRCKDLPRSHRLRELRVGVTALFVLCAVCTVQLPDDFPGRDGLSTFLVFAGVLVFAGLSIEIRRMGRRERRIDRDRLVDQGLPVRPRLVSWRVIASVCFVAGPLLILILALAVLVPIALIGGGHVGTATGEAVIAGVSAAWLAAAVGLTARQARRQRRSDKRYWMQYRAAVRARAGAVPASSTDTEFSESASRATTPGGDT